MSTTGRSRAPGRTARGGEVAERGNKVTARVVRVRNVCLLHAAARLSLPLPTDAELAALPADMTLKQSVGWLQAQRTPAETGRTTRSRSHDDRPRSRAGTVLGRVARVVIVVAGALALTFGKAQ